MKEKILIVEDSITYRAIISSVLSDYPTLIAEDGEEAIKIIDTHEDIDIIILDIKMPKVDGFGVLKHIKEHHSESDIVVIILTNVDEVETEIKGLESGAVDYIRKPINADSLLKRIEVHSHLIEAKKEILAHNKELEKRVIERTHQLNVTKQLTLQALTGLLELRDAESSNHSKRTQYMMRALAEELYENSIYRNFLSPSLIDEIQLTAPLHDIGKVGISDNILLKPGKLSADEYIVMKEHVKLGACALQTNFGTDYSIPFIGTALKIIQDHHERYDGKGYPRHLRGEEISLEGRMMGIVDVYDALRSKRVYKEAYSHEKSMEIIISERGKHFDPIIVDAFVRIEPKLLEIFDKYGVDGT